MELQFELVMKFMSNDTSKITSTDVLKTDSKSIGNYRDSSFDLDRGKYAQYGKLGNTWNNFDSALGSIVVSNENTGKMKKTEQISSSNGILITTGGTEKSNVMNIYDIAGNVLEWTLEKTTITGPCAGRGGVYDDSGSSRPAANRYGPTTDYSDYNAGFRVSLF